MKPQNAIGFILSPLGLFAGTSTGPKMTHVLVLPWDQVELLARKVGSRSRWIGDTLADGFKKTGFILSDYGMSLEHLEKDSSSNFVSTFPWNKMPGFIEKHGMKAKGTESESGWTELLTQIKAPVDPAVLPVTAQITPLAVILMVFDKAAGLCHTRYMPWAELGEVAKTSPIQAPLDLAWKKTAIEKKVVINIGPTGLGITLYDKTEDRSFHHALPWLELGDFARKTGSTYVTENVSDVKNALIDAVQRMVLPPS